jgi:hypothetical protein
VDPLNWFNLIGSIFGFWTCVSAIFVVLFTVSATGESTGSIHGRAGRP